MIVRESERIARLPGYLFGEINRQKLEVRRGGIDVIDLGMGNPDLAPAPHIVDKLCQVARDRKAHRYSASRGIPHLRRAICESYGRKFGVELDAEREAVVTIGSKEGISHLMLALLNRGDTVVLQDPTYPAYTYAIMIAGGNVCSLPVCDEERFFPEMDKLISKTLPKPKMVVVSFPHNPTTATVELGFFEELVRFARRRRVAVVHDLAYSELCFDGYRAPSFLEVKGAKDVGIEFYTMSKSYSMAGWRVGFAVGNESMVGALARIKSYYDYGIFTPVQVAAIVALKGPQKCVRETCQEYQRRRDVFVSGLARLGWEVETPKATMYVWAAIPEHFRSMGSLKFTSHLLEKGAVAAAPGIGFGSRGDGHVRFALVENEQRLRQAVRGIKTALGVEPRPSPRKRKPRLPRRRKS